MGKVYFISDLHFGHRNIIKYDNRPFFSIKEMDETIIVSWNKKVKTQDTVYVLGDISWYDKAETTEIVHHLNGRKILILGNHDNAKDAKDIGFSEVYDYKEISVDNKKVILSHYPIPFWNGQFKETIHLYGHVHNSSQYGIFNKWIKEARQLYDIPLQCFNVGCMMPYMEYTPQTLNEIIKKNERKENENNELFFQK